MTKKKHPLIKAASTLQKLINKKPKTMDVVADHYICYGDKEPLCGIELGNRGIIKDVTYTTCPECLMQFGDE